MNQENKKQRKPAKRLKSERFLLSFTPKNKQKLMDAHQDYLSNGGSLKSFSAFLEEKCLMDNSIIYKEKIGIETFKILNRTTNNLNQLLILMRQTKSANQPVDSNVLKKASECLDSIIDFTIENRVA
ncbi:MAG: hypothetical protein ABJF04_25700 [Reichenbachiella sp.]|uniref:hypothetical protein n=1 Tax=Reichenbachiella sp. TaxID=2184521 RepID=UPI003266E4DD